MESIVKGWQRRPSESVCLSVTGGELLSGLNIDMFNELFPVLVISTCIAQIYAELHSKSWERNNDLTGRMFDIPMFSIISRGRIHCAMICAMETCCKTLTFNPNTKGCTGYCRNTTDGDTFTSDPGREVYQWINPPNNFTCVYNTDANLCFSLKTDRENKHGAADQCNLDNGNLIRIDTLEKLSAVEIVLRDYYDNSEFVNVWIDGEDFDKTNNYTMSNGQVLSLNTTFWSPGEPNGIDETCVGLYHKYKMNDWPCSLKNLYLCEY